MKAFNASLKEIRDVLLGKTVLDEHGWMHVPGAGEFRLPVGIPDGAASIRVLGLSVSSWMFSTELSEEDAVELARQCMQNIGRRVILRESPGAAACFIRSVFVRPAVMVFAYENGVPVLSIYSGRSVTGPAAVNKAYRDFTVQLPKTMVPAGKIARIKKKKGVK